jgi:DNA-binding XRE family transcriptional regulator
MKTQNELELLTQEEHDNLLMADWKPEDHEFNRSLVLAFEERNLRKSLAEAVIARRSHLKISQRALAKLVGISTRDICHIEKGKSNPTLSTQVKLLSSLGLTLQIHSK